ncbi:MAG TPA: hypothetical protein VFJ82_07945 [Longimicrobium sp.]|nr:hypothetical protein [Longimicrobium sp.]
MKKLELNLDQVQVVSFAVETAGRNGGTVNGFARDTDRSCFFCVPDPVSETQC